MPSVREVMIHDLFIARALTRSRTDYPLRFDEEIIYPLIDRAIIREITRLVIPPPLPIPVPFPFGIPTFPISRKNSR